MHTIRFVAVASGCLVALAGCKKAIPSPMPPDEPSQVARTGDSVRVRIFLDATWSMRGFAKGTGSPYQTTLRSLESALSSEWPAGRLTFFAFGSSVRRLASREHLLAVDSAWYGRDSALARTTRINFVIDSVVESDLAIVVTDLYQQDADVNLVARQITERFLRHGLAMGIVGIKSAFDGRVYDVGLQNERRNLRYRGERPFYVMLFGSRVLVMTALRRLLQVSRIDSSKALVLSQTLVESVVDAPKIDSTRGLNIRNRLVRGGDTLKLLQVQLTAESGYVRVSVPWQRASWGPEFADRAVDVRVSPWEWSSRRISPAPSDGNAPASRDSLKAPSARSAGSWVRMGENRKWATVAANPSGESVHVEIRLQKAELECGLYALDIAIGPEPQRLRLPTWIDAWNLPDSLVQAGGDELGRRTLNLRPLLESLLYGAFRTSNTPILANFRVYVQRPCGLGGS